MQNRKTTQLAGQHAIARLHYITQAIGDRTHAHCAEAACSGGVRWVQLRVKNAQADDWRREALAVQHVCANYGAVLIINDNAALAADIGADGVHLGKEDMPIEKARALLGANAIIGGTANTFDDIRRLADANADYIGLGPFRFTTTKEKLSPVLGLSGYSAVFELCAQAGINIPVIAIGGITPGDTASLLQVGAYGIAVSSAINAAERPAHAAEQFLHELHAQATQG